MESIRIRAGKREDLKEVFSLVKELAEFEKAPEQVTSTIADYEREFDQGNIRTLIAESEEKTIGMMLFFTTFSTWRGKMLYLEDFVVTPAWRSKGAGQMLFDEFIRIAKDEDYKLVKWQVLDWNEHAIRFYKRNGASIENEWFNGKIIF